ncbi:MAG: hemerythrin family protein [Magnetococcales bacterium]|nr:hemerythrin family protein [Magnetococcales bacterium]
METPPIIIWKSHLSVQVASIDEDHKKLIKMINRLFGAILSVDPEQVLWDILAELTEYVVVHFKREEEYMRRFDYPDLVVHLEDHQRLIAATRQFKLNLESGLDRTLLKAEVENSLRDWLVNHILGMDHLLGQFLNQQGIR